MIFLILIIIGIIINKQAFAWEMNLNDYENKSGGRAGNKVTDVMGAVINIVSTISAGIAIIMLIVMGIQYVSKGAAGKAEAKKDLTGYIIGAVILFGTSGILKLTQMFINSNLNSI